MASAVSRGHSPEVREIVRHLHSLGFEYKGTPQSSGHLNFEHPAYGKYVLPSSPSDSRWKQNVLSDLAKRLDLSKGELELKLGIRQKKNRGPKRQRKRNHVGIQYRKVWGGALKEDSAPAEAARPRTLGELAAAIQQATHAVEATIPDNPAYRSALAELARLRGEYLQLEEDMA